MDTLPPEIIIEILSYLSWHELKQTRLTCKQLYNLSNNFIPKRCGIKVKHLEEIGSKEFQYWLKSKNIAFHTVSLTRQFFNEDVMPNSDFKMLINVFHPQTKKIYLGNNYLSDVQFKLVMDRCPSLECLGIIKETFGDIFTNLERIEELNKLKSFSNLYKFRFQSGCNGFRRGNVFQLLTNAMPNIENVSIHLITIDDNYITIRDFLAECEQMLLEFIQKQVKKLKSVTFLGWKLPMFLSYLAVPGLDLKDLDIDIRTTSGNRNTELEFARTITELIIKQKRLKRLRFAQWNFDDEMLEKITYNLKQIRTFEMDYCHLNWSSHSVDVFRHFEKLENLTLERNLISSVLSGIANVFLSKENFSMQSIKLSGYLGESQTFFNEIHNIKNLTCLQLDTSSQDFMFDDWCWQQIISSLKKLKILKIRGCRKISDAAIYNANDLNKCISSLQHLEHFMLKLTTSTDNVEFLLSDVVVLELLKLKHLRTVVLPDSTMISQECHQKLSDYVSYSRVERFVHR